jgi:hypothetical protein
MKENFGEKKKYEKHAEELHTCKYPDNGRSRWKAKINWTGRNI